MTRACCKHHSDSNSQSASGAEAPISGGFGGTAKAVPFHLGIFETRFGQNRKRFLLPSPQRRAGYCGMVCGIALLLLMAFPAQAQEADGSGATGGSGNQPQIRLNYMNVCVPNAKDQEVLVSALNSMLPAASPIADYEQTRGRATTENEVVWYIRLRREFPAKSAFTTAQYTIQEDGEKMSEVLVLHPRDSKTTLQILLEDSAPLQSGPLASFLSVNSPVTRIKIERFGSSSVGLSRCEEADQHAYDAIFHQASQVFAAYRGSLGLKSLLRTDLTWLQERASNSNKEKKKESSQTGSGSGH